MKDLKYYIITASALLVIYVSVSFNRPKTVDWSQSFKNTDKIPFGTYVLFNRMNDIFPGAKISTYRKPIYNVLDTPGKQGTYIIICDDADINEYDHAKLTKFIKQGNNVFIAATSFGGYFSKHLKIRSRTTILEAEKNAVRFVNKDLDNKKFYKAGRDISSNYFSSMDTARAIVLGDNKGGKVNFVKYQMGKGALYLNANPLLFTNYMLLQPGNSNYAATALSYLGGTRNIIWDEYYSRGRGGNESLLRVFLANVQLKSALYIAFFGLLVFVIYEMKRRQRIIPVIEPLTNTATEFATVVGQVYYEQRDNQNIAGKKATYFLEHIRNRYYLKTGLLNREFAETLAQKSGADIALVKSIIRRIEYIRGHTSLSDHELIELNNDIERFYTQAR